MYEMLEKSHPKCPQCNNDVLVDFAVHPHQLLLQLQLLLLLLPQLVAASNVKELPKLEDY
jgi:hypothetical protein